MNDLFLVMMAIFIVTYFVGGFIAVLFVVCYYVVAFCFAMVVGKLMSED